MRPCSEEWKFTDGGKSVSRDTVILSSEQQEEEKEKRAVPFLELLLGCSWQPLCFDFSCTVCSFALFFFFLCDAV